MLRLAILCILVGSISACSTAKKPDSPVSKANTPAESSGKSSTVNPNQAEAKTEVKKRNEYKLTCVRGSESRIIVVSKEPTRQLSEVKSEPLRVCDVLYTRYGKTDMMAHAKKDVSYCDQVGKKIRENLETAGFTCK